jgi:hypothetical protein
MQTTSGKFFELYYGPSGSGKSESIVAVIKRIFKETGKKFRVLVGDGSTATYEPLVEAGIAEMLDYTTRDWPLSTLTQLCQGYWPLSVEDPKSKMVAMTKEQFATIGGYAIEGLSVGASYVMGDKRGGFSEQASRGVKIGGDNPVKLVDAMFDLNGIPIKDSGPMLTFGSVTLGGYGQAQRRMLGFVEASKGLPGWVIWTAHERASEEKISNQKVVGPEVAGGALTSGLSKHFNNTLHFTTAEKVIKKKDGHTEAMVQELDAEYRIYTRHHFRPEGNTFVKYLAVSRTPDPKSMPLYLESETPGVSIIEFYKKVREAREKSIAELKAAPPAA